MADARQLLHHDAAGADVQVADLGIAHLAVGQPDIEAGRGAARVRRRHEPVERRRVGLADSVVRRLLAPAPAIEDDEHDGAGRAGDGMLGLYRAALAGARL